MLKKIWFLNSALFGNEVELYGRNRFTSFIYLDDTYCIGIWFQRPVQTNVFLVEMNTQEIKTRLPLKSLCAYQHFHITLSCFVGRLTMNGFSWTTLNKVPSLVFHSWNF